MTDILCGKLIAAADWTQTQQSSDSTAISNITNTTFTKGTPEVSVTFVAPTSGRVMIYVGGEAQNNSYNGTTNTDYCMMSIEVRTGSSSGTIIHSPDTQGAPWVCRWPGPATRNSILQRAGIYTGLTPGSTYYVSHQYRSAFGQTSVDIGNRQLIVRPLP